MNDFSARNVCAEMKSKNEQDSLCSAESVETKASSLNENRTNATPTAQTNVKVVPRLYGWEKWDYLNGTNEAELCLRLNRCCEFTKGWKEKQELKTKELGKDDESDKNKNKQEGLNEMDTQNCSALNSVDGFVVGILTRLWIHAHGKGTHWFIVCLHFFICFHFSFNFIAIIFFFFHSSFFNLILYCNC